jgi:hypothetical protein
MVDEMVSYLCVLLPSIGIDVVQRQGDTKVYELHVACAGERYVLGFDVVVHDACCVQVVYGFNHLVYKPFLLQWA